MAHSRYDSLDENVLLALLKPMQFEFLRSKDTSFPTKRFRFACSETRYSVLGSDALEHDTYEFLWDGKINLADQASSERAQAYGILDTGRIKCRCGKNVWYNGAFTTEDDASNEKSVSSEKNVLMQQKPAVILGSVEKEGLPSPVGVPAGTIFVDDNTGVAFVRTSFGSWQPMTHPTLNGKTNEQMPQLTPDEIILLRQKLGLALDMKKQSSEPITEEDVAALKNQLTKATTVTIPNLEPGTRLIVEVPKGSYTSPTDVFRGDLNQTITEKTMTEAIAAKPTFMTRAVATAKSDTFDATWRVVANQTVRMVRDPLIALVSNHFSPGDEVLRKRITSLLATDIGEAIVSGVIAFLCNLAPEKFSFIPEPLQKEFRVRSYALGIDFFIELIAKPLRQMLTSGFLSEAIETAKKITEEGIRIPEDIVSETRASDALDSASASSLVNERATEPVATRDQKAAVR